MMVEDIGVPLRVESERNGESVFSWELMEEKNRSLPLNGHAWNWGDGPVPCTVRCRYFGLEEAKRAILKETERQDSRGALQPKSKPLATTVDLAPGYVREVSISRERTHVKRGGQTGGKKGREEGRSYASGT